MSLYEPPDGDTSAGQDEEQAANLRPTGKTRNLILRQPGKETKMKHKRYPKYFSLTHSDTERPKQARRFWNILHTIAFFWKTFEGEMLPVRQTTNLLGIFCEPPLYSHFIFRSMGVTKDNFIYKNLFSCQIDTPCK